MSTKGVAVQDAPGVEAVRLIRDRSDQFLDLLGGDQRATDRWLNVALHAVTSNPDLLKCEPMSLVEAVRASASMGLELNGLMGEAYIIKYGPKAQFQVGWRGLLRLARRSGDIAAIDAHVVYSNDLFDVDLGSESKVTHKPALSDRGNRVGVYGWARLTSGELVVEWMDNDSVEMVRRASRGQSGPWVDWYDEMARKTVIKRLCKRLPLDSLAQRALEAEARVDSLATEQSRPTRHSTQQAPSQAIQRVQEQLGITSGRDDAPETTFGEPTFGRAASGQDHEADDSSETADLAGARTVTPDEGPGSTAAGNPTPASPDGSEVTPFASEPSDMPPPPDTAKAICGDDGGMMGQCQRAPGHARKHQGPGGEWPQERGR